MRHYSNLAYPRPLQAGIDESETVLQVESTDGYPDAPFVVALERGTENMEACLVTDKGSTSLTVERGYDGTLALSHDSDVLVEHVALAIDYREGIAVVSEAQRDGLDDTDLWDGRVVYTEGSGGGGRLEVAVGEGWDSIVPPGTILPFAGSAAPVGWLLLSGQEVSRTAFADLFEVFGTTYGAGDGLTTFNLPDLRQRFPLGKADSGTGDTLGDSGGAINHTHTQPSHTHSGPSHTHSNPNTSTANAHTHTFSSNTGSNGSHSHGSSFSTGNANLIMNVKSGLPAIQGGNPQGHQHSVTGSTPTGGSHTHSLPQTNGAGAYSHSQGNTGSSGTGETGSSGGETLGSANPPFIALNYIVRV